jgi:tRNA G18 (ribose-2'-O)-methylase SpoU
MMLDQIVYTDQEKMAVIFGNEVSGISDDVIAMFDESIEIPQFGTKHSMNVAVSAGIVLWHLLYGKR